MYTWLMLAASPVTAQGPQMDDAARRAAVTDCGSVVIVKCESPASAGGINPSEPVPQFSRVLAARRESAGIQSLDGVIIEGEAVRRRSLSDTMAGPFPQVRARDGSHTVDNGDGSKCTCMNVCPPFPFACCTCSSLMSRYRSMPGSSPLN